MFPVTRYGAVGDGKTKNTVAFQKAFDACGSAGGGEVTVPAGTFPVYRVELSGLSQNLTYFVTTAAPFRIVKMAIAGTPVEFVLVK